MLELENSSEPQTKHVKSRFPGPNSTQLGAAVQSEMDQYNIYMIMNLKKPEPRKHLPRAKKFNSAAHPL